MDYISSIRKLAKNTELLYKAHAFEQMMLRGIESEDVENILTSSTNEILEIQPPTNKCKDERILLYDKNYPKDIIVVSVMTNFPRIEVITAEFVDYNKWKKVNNKLVRK